MTQIEIGNLAICFAIVIATLMIALGWAKMPVHVRATAVSAVLLFVGYQIIEFVLTSFIVIAK